VTSRRVGASFSIVCGAVGVGVAEFDRAQLLAF
jgi:hypothetical protein